MVPVEVKEQIQVLEPAPEKLNPKAVEQVADILAESDKPATSRETETGHWFYRMPFPGVRYYSY